MVNAEASLRLRKGSCQVFPLVPRNSGFSKIPEGGLKGTCPLCGKLVAFLDFTEIERESGFCPECGSFNRQRQIVFALRALCGQDATGPLRMPEGFVIYNTESTRAVHNLLCSTPEYICSEYFGPGISPGPYAGNTRHEDLQRLSLESESVDLVLSSDVIEHIPHPYEAHRQIYRVLKSGGRHIFTVPFNEESPLDDVRATEAHGHVTYLKEKKFHGDPMKPDEGVLVWTLPGLQMLIELTRIGFEVSMFNLHEPEYGIIGPWSLVFDAKKP